MHKRYFLFYLFLAGGLLSATGQIQLTGTAVTINFDGTPAEAGNGAFLGDGFSQLPLSGQLNSNAFAFTGFSDGDSDFGDLRTSGDFARGSTGGGSQLGGIYAATVGSQFTLDGGSAASGQAIFIRLDEQDFTPGTMTIKTVNQTGGTLTGITLSAEVCIADDRSGSSNFELAYSDNGTTFTKTTFSINSGDNPDGTPTNTAVCNPTGPLDVTGINVPPGGNFFLRLLSNDASGPGAGQLDAIALDNITFGSFVLPVRLAEFSAHPTADGNRLLWATATERNNDYFELERSTNAIDWTTVERIRGSGTTSTVQHYQHLDRAAPLGRVYYRLRQVDFDGTVAYHRTITIEGAEQGGSAVFPNPVDEVLNIHLEAAAQIRVSNLTGKELTVRQFDTAGRYVLSTADWLPGIYFVTAQTGPRRHTWRIVKP